MKRDPYRYFRIEAHELQEQMGRCLLELDKGRAAPEVIAALLRFAHTLKGAARVVKQREIAELAHAIEGTLGPFRGGEHVVPREAIDAALKAMDGIGAHVQALGEPVGPDVSAAGTAVGSEPSAADTAGSSSEAATPIEELERLLNAVGEAAVHLSTLKRGFDALRHARRLGQVLADPELRSPANERHSRATERLPTLDDLRAALDRANRHLGEGMEQMERELFAVREAAQRLRLVPVDRMFLALERAARDAARMLGKEVEFRSAGGDVRLDSAVFTRVQGALLQAVRNAVAHGVETPAERAKAGKPPRGRVTVEVHRRRHQAVFTCRDDGAGVDLDAVARAARRKGLLAEGATPGTEELLRLLLGGGISTSGSVTEIAGRGIGLDVVSEAARGLRGGARMTTDTGGGTVVEIVVPIALAAIDTLLVESDGRTVAIPLDAVKTTLRVARDDLAQSAQGSALLYEGNVIPFAPLDRALHQDRGDRAIARQWSAVVIQGTSALAAVGVERLRGTQNVLLHPLPEAAPSAHLIAGASFDAEGVPQLVLDPDGVVDHVLRTAPSLDTARATRTTILVIDDSLTTRMLEQSILESAGYEVDLASSGEDGLERAARRRYALFLVDVEMPGMDGYTFIERTQADPLLRDVPAVLVTSLSSPESRRRGEIAGARAYIVKGEFDQNALLSEIQRLVAER